MAHLETEFMASSIPVMMKISLKALIHFAPRCTFYMYDSGLKKQINTPKQSSALVHIIECTRMGLTCVGLRYEKQMFA